MVIHDLRAKFTLIISVIIITCSKTQAEISLNPNRSHTVPIIYTRGTHYEIGFQIGKTFAEMIRNYLDIHPSFNEDYLPTYQTPEGRKVYDETLAAVKKQYPQYIREIQGTADGSGVPFYKLFLMHLDDIGPNAAGRARGNHPGSTGCTDIICNWPGQEIYGHNEDALNETLDHWYLVDAHVVEPGLPEEKFCSLSYAGLLPGYTLGFNHHGLVYGINTIFVKVLRSGKTPRYFLTRAILGANNYAQVVKILQNEGYGAADGFTINLSFQQKGPRKFHNIEVAPVAEGKNSSGISILTTGPGKYFYHTNRYLRLKVAEDDTEMQSSIHRERVIKKRPPPKNIQDIVNIISDQTDKEWPIYRGPQIKVATLCTGIFDLGKKTLAIYTDRPSHSEPAVVLPLRFKDDL